VVFGLFHLLGYQFSPRLADLGGMRFWRIDPAANYGTLNGIARSRIDTTLITENWEDMLCVVGSLKLGTVDPSELMRTLQSSGRASTLAKAIGGVGRIAKTLFLYVTWNTAHQQRKTGLFFSFFHQRKTFVPRKRSPVKAA
jgi:TnpA family transposase